MNINTTINLDDLLNSNEENSSEEVVEILKESITETAKSIEENAPLPDFDAIVTEWSYRCDKGYPDMKNKSDMIKLQEILNEMGVKSPFKQIEEAPKPKKAKTVSSKPSAANIATFKKLINSNRKQLNFENESIYTSIFKVFDKLNATEQAACIKTFQKMSPEEFEGSGWKIWQKFFDARGEGGTLPGRGEMMAVMAIKGASSGGSKEKDLQIQGGSYEIKEKPNSIRMAKSGAIGKFQYVSETKDFYRLLTKIDLNNKGNDDQLKKNLNKIFNTEAIAEQVYNTLTNNFRGDSFKPSKEDVAEGATAENFFDRTSTSEWPEGVIELHYQGFLALNKIRATVKSNQDLINNAKLILRTAKSEKDLEYYINPQDSDEISNAKSGQDVTIQVATPAKGDIVEFLQIMLEIIKHTLVKSPKLIIEDFIRVRNSYFKSSNIKGILYYFGGTDSQPHFGYPKDFLVTSISQGNGKMKLTTQAAKNSKSSFIKDLVASSSEA